jgi:putative membrane protein
MALASLGALIAMVVTAAINIWLQRDFAREWAESLRIKDVGVTGEDAILEMLKTRAPRA